MEQRRRYTASKADDACMLVSYMLLALDTKTQAKNAVDAAHSWTFHTLPHRTNAYNEKRHRCVRWL